MSAILEVRGLAKSYGTVEVLKGVAFDLDEGATLALIGPNGAGKTTLFRVLTGEAPAQAGEIRLDGASIARTPAHERVRRGIGRTFQVARVFLEMTALENVTVAVERRRRMDGQPAGPWYRASPSGEVSQEARRWLGDLGLDRAAGVEARFLSHGDRKRLELALALALKPRILMLDEPTAGMSPPERHETLRLLQRLKAGRGLTMMMTEHDMDVVFGLADSVIVLNYGEIIARGAPEAVRADPVVRQVYLGREADHA